MANIKLTKSDRLEIIEMARKGLSLRKIAKVFQVSHTAIANVLKGC